MPLWRRILFGRPIATAQAHEEKLPKYMALPIFASDAISSVAYATEEILRTLLLSGVAASLVAGSVFPISASIAVLLVVVVISYLQTIHAYPNGGGSYLVAKENLGTLPGLTAGAALMIDYILTVSVSIAAGVAAIVAAFPGLNGHQVALCVGFITVLTLANLRGLKESGNLFMLPTYSFLLFLYGLIAIGMVRFFTGAVTEPTHVAAPSTDPVGGMAAPLTLFLILKAFSSGCAAMTGTEAISNGVPSFRPPESRNAGITLMIMASILASLFLGVSFLAWKFGTLPDTHGGGHGGGTDTVISMLAARIYGRGTFFFYGLQFATCALLIVAANAAFAGFPRLTMLLAQDRFLPRQMANIGDRLVFSNGILLLAVLATSLVVAFGGSTHALIPLYAVGVFLSFTLSQSGMVVRWWRLRSKNWQRNALINGFGATCTGIVLCVIAYTKFFAGDPISFFPLTTPIGLWLIATAVGFVLISMYHRWMGKWLVFGSALLFAAWWMFTGALGPIELNKYQFRDAKGLALRLQAQKGPLSRHIYSHLPQQVRAELAQYDGTGTPPESLVASLAAALNAEINGGPLWDEARFPEVRLRKSTRALLAKNPQGDELRRLNRFLLEDAFDRELESSRGILRKVELHLGAWMVVLVIPMLVWMCYRIHRHYDEVAEHLTMERYRPLKPMRHTVLVSVPGVHRGIMPALAYARSIGGDIRAVYVELNPDETPEVLRRWSRWVPDIPLVVLESPYRSLTEPLLTYIDAVERERDDDVVTVILPEFVTEKWWTKLLHNQTGFVLKLALLWRKGVVVTNIRYHLDDFDEDLGEHPLVSGVSVETPEPVAT